MNKKSKIKTREKNFLPNEINETYRKNQESIQIRNYYFKEKSFLYNNDRNI
jgi:hypothetical protein